MFGSAQNSFREPVESGPMKMKLYVRWPNEEDTPELHLALESYDRDSLKSVAHALARLKIADPSSAWQTASDGSEQLLIEGQCAFVIKT